MTEAMRLAGDQVAATPFRIPGSRGEFRIQLLNEDAARGVVTSIVHIPAGGFIPAHRHQAGAEMHFVLAGDLTERGEALGPGGFLTHAAGVVHGPHESRAGALVLTVQHWQSKDGDYDFELVEAAPAAAAGGAASLHGEAPPAEAQRADAAQDKAPVQDGGETAAAVRDAAGESAAGGYG